MRLISLVTAFVTISIAPGCIITPGEDGDTDDTGTGSESSTESGSSSTTAGSSGPDSDSNSGSSSTTADGTGGSSSGADTDGGGSANARCNAFCEAFVRAGCDNNLTMDGCLLTCQTLTSSELCDPTANAYFDCVDGSTVECDAQGVVYAVGCGLDYLEAIACAVTEDPNPAIVEPCAEYCGTIADQMCPNSDTEDNCNTRCRWNGNTGSGCDGQWQAYMDCATAADWSCILGVAVPSMCGEPYAAYWDCLNNPT